MTIVSILGEPNRSELIETDLPPKLAELLRANGEGVLAGQVRLFASGSPSHQEAARRFEAARGELHGWSWTRSSEVVCSVVGELLEGRGYVLAVRAARGTNQPVRSARGLWLAHRWGSIHPCGEDLDGLTQRIVDGMVVELELEAQIDHHRRDILTPLPIEATYDVRDDDEGAGLRAAIEAGDEDSFDDKLQEFLSHGLIVDRVRGARRIATDAGPNGTAILETLDIIQRRNPGWPDFEGLAERVATHRVELSTALEEIGAHGGEPPSLAIRQFWSALPLNLELGSKIRKALVDSRRMAGPGVSSLLLEHVTQCSEDDVLAVAAILLAAVHGHPRRDYFTFISSLDPLESPWTEIEPMARLWPLVGIFLLSSEYWAVTRAALLIPRFTDPASVGVIDSYLTARSIDADLAATTRLKLRPLVDQDVEWIRSKLAAHEPLAKDPSAPRASGLLYLLVFAAKLDSAIDLLTDQTARDLLGLDLSPAFEAAEVRGNDVRSRRLLHLIWRSPNRGLFLAERACRLGASWGDVEARRALPRIEAMAEREGRNLDRM